MDATQQVLAAADALVAAFASNDVDAYFGAFAPEASFIFHASPVRLMSRDAYRAEWDGWVADSDLRVLDCVSSNRAVQFVDGIALFMHDVNTTIATRDGEATLAERETIVFRQDESGRWLAWHEHLSPRAA
ncbi:YybH family protein [Crenobacter cavernae]|uniref:DUF4440 domain-containing protein n=1 Tax=Crenobacter cavernae TaxID=2290923 RepID=A0ABY0FGT7_9NEIS|nr:nuclear transport factor 2 family protein [Crenobacter cavernae]RXZ45609.1 DUF4440 domain-containing protein [Crenobacter cavernae]